MRLPSHSKLRARPWYGSGLWKTQNGWLVFCRECGVAAEAKRFNENWCSKEHAPLWWKRQRLRGGCHQLVAKAIRRKELRPPNEYQCADCDKQAEVYEHRDYRAPLAVEPVCRSCNQRRGPGAPFDFLTAKAKQRAERVAKEIA